MRPARTLDSPAVRGPGAPGSGPGAGAIIVEIHNEWRGPPRSTRWASRPVPALPNRARGSRTPGSVAAPASGAGSGPSLAGCAFAAVAAIAGAQATDESITLNFANADIDAVVKAVAEITGKNFIVDPKIKGTVTIVSARPVPRSLVYPTLLSALRMQGIAAIEADGVVRLVQDADARLQAGPVAPRAGVGAAATASSRRSSRCATSRRRSSSTCCAR